jgi:GT2 family glycosyltransferase
MFMLFRSAAFRKVGGFDERYFLYYEDVDLCARLRRAGYDIRVEAAVRVVHDARRDSRRSVRYMAWHLSSILRYFLTRPRNLPPLG